MPMRRTECKLCSVALEVRRMPRPPHWGKWTCPRCGQTYGFAPTPPEEAHSYTMPFGKFKGRTLGEIIKTPEGRDYLEWAAERMSRPRMREVIGTFLARRPTSTTS
jgi:uncharacterized protein (DUF3820 family)